MQYHIHKFARTTRIIITAQVREESDEANHISLGTKLLDLSSWPHIIKQKAQIIERKEVERSICPEGMGYCYYDFFYKKEDILWERKFVQN
jgi:hypothetical protein